MSVCPGSSSAKLVGLGGFEPPTSPLSGVRSNQLSYRPNHWSSWRLSQRLARLLNEPSLRAYHAFSRRYRDWFWNSVRFLSNSPLFEILRSDNLYGCSRQEPLRRSLKEVIQPQVPLGLPCYDFTPVMNHKVVSVLPKVRLPTSFATHSHGVTGGVYKARERIHRSILICDY